MSEQRNEVKGSLGFPHEEGRWISSRELEALHALHEGEVRRLRGEIHRLKSEHRLHEQWAWSTPYGPWGDDLAPHSHLRQYGSREQVEAHAEAHVAGEDDARYAILRRYVTDWEVMP